MSTIRRHTQQTKTPTVSARPSIEQSASLPPITEQHQTDQPGTLSLLTRPITEFHSGHNQLLHCEFHDQSQSSPPNSTQQKDQSHIINQLSDYSSSFSRKVQLQKSEDKRTALVAGM